MYYSDKMSFYCDKLNLKKSVIDENLEKIRDEITEKKQREINGLSYLLNTPMTTRYGFGNFQTEANYQKLKLLQKEMKMFEGMTTEQFFNHLSKIESYCWVNFLQKAEILKDSHEKDLNKFKNSKLKIKIFGLDKKALDRKQSLVDEDKKQLEDYTACRDEWAKLSKEEKMYFVCSRYLAENETKITKKDLDEYLKNLYAEKEAQKESENAPESGN